MFVQFERFRNNLDIFRIFAYLVEEMSAMNRQKGKTGTNERKNLDIEGKEYCKMTKIRK